MKKIKEGIIYNTLVLYIFCCFLFYIEKVRVGQVVFFWQVFMLLFEYNENFKLDVIQDEKELIDDEY